VESNLKKKEALLFASKNTKDGRDPTSIGKKKKKKREGEREREKMKRAETET
jgi:hypothetical protein